MQDKIIEKNCIDANTSQKDQAHALKKEISSRENQANISIQEELKSSIGMNLEPQPDLKMTSDLKNLVLIKPRSIELKERDSKPKALILKKTNNKPKEIENTKPNFIKSALIKLFKWLKSFGDPFNEERKILKGLIIENEILYLKDYYYQDVLNKYVKKINSALKEIDKQISSYNSGNIKDKKQFHTEMRQHLKDTIEIFTECREKIAFLQNTINKTDILQAIDDIKKIKGSALNKIKLIKLGEKIEPAATKKIKKDMHSTDLVQGW